MDTYLHLREREGADLLGGSSSCAVRHRLTQKALALIFWNNYRFTKFLQFDGIKMKYVKCILSSSLTAPYPLDSAVCTELAPVTMTLPCRRTPVGSGRDYAL